MHTTSFWKMHAMFATWPTCESHAHRACSLSTWTKTHTGLNFSRQHGMPYVKTRALSSKILSTPTVLSSLWMISKSTITSAPIDWSRLMVINGCHPHYTSNSQVLDMAKCVRQFNSPHIITTIEEFMADINNMDVIWVALCFPLLQKTILLPFK